MAKGLKLNLKNEQIAKAIDLDNIKSKLAKPKKKPAAKKPAKTKETKVKTKSLTTTKEKTTKKTPAKTKKIPAKKEAVATTTKQTTKKTTKTPPPTKKLEETAKVEKTTKKAPVVKETPPPPKQEKESIFTNKRIDLDVLKSRQMKRPKPKKAEPISKTNDEKTTKQPPKKSFSNQTVSKELKKDDLFENFGDKKGGANKDKFFKYNKYKNFQNVKSLRHTTSYKSKKKQKNAGNNKSSVVEETAKTIVRPSSLSVRIPVSIKDLANEMKIKSSELISKLFMHGLVHTINDYLDDETTIQLIGQEFECEITIDTSEEERIKITDKTIEEEIKETQPELLQNRPPIIAFMGHVDHGKTSLIDVIRKSNIVANEKGAITQHIGAFRYVSDHGSITIIDTPGHEAFTSMRKRGAHITDVVVLVVAGDEGVRDQTIEAIKHAKESKATIIVAINKCDKSGFNAENVYRQLADNELIPETWGGSTVTINCSATTKEKIPELLDMIILQSELLELKASPSTRARGAVIESALHKGLGIVATVLVQNGSLKYNDAIVFENTWGRIKTMHDEFGNTIEEAPPATPVRITGLTEVPQAGEEFIVVNNEKEARKIAEMRAIENKPIQYRQKNKTFSAESLLQKSEDEKKKILNVILRTDVHGSLEALSTCLSAINSDKVILNITSAAVGEISESDVELAEASKALVIGFQTRVEANAEPFIKKQKITVLLHNIIYHVIDDVKNQMRLLLDKIPQEKEMGLAKVQATFKSSQLGVIAGCLVTKGSIHRNHLIRVLRNEEEVWSGKISSIKKEKNDLTEVQKDNECGILLDGFNNVEIDDILQTYEIEYLEQDL